MSDKVFQKGFMQGCGCAFGVLSCPLIILSLWGIVTPTVLSLQKIEYVEWHECQLALLGVDKRIKQTLCGKEPKRWKWN